MTCKSVAEILSETEANRLKSDIELDDVIDLINNLQAVFYISDQSKCIFTFHASFPEFLTAVRGAGEITYQPMKHHMELTLASINIMRKLRFNICGLPSSFICDKDVPNLTETIEEEIGESFQYACQFWSFHFVHCEVKETIIQELKTFLMKKGIYWIEVMSLMGLLSDCGKDMELIIKVSSCRKNCLELNIFEIESMY